MDDGTPPIERQQELFRLRHRIQLAAAALLPSNWTVWAEQLLSFTATATDEDLPAQMKLFSIDPGGPSDAHIDPATGLFTWTPRATNAGTNTMVLRVTDDGAPPASPQARCKSSFCRRSTRASA